MRCRPSRFIRRLARALTTIKAVAKVLALYQRLFPTDNVPFTLQPVQGGRPIRFNAESSIMPPRPMSCASRPRRSFWPATMLSGGSMGSSALRNCCMGRAMMRKPSSFRSSAILHDQPRYDWRGCHLDVSRQFYPVADIERLIDILAWNKLNIFHWHLTDDEAWRLEIKAYPQLTEIGARRGTGRSSGAAARRRR